MDIVLDIARVALVPELVVVVELRVPELVEMSEGIGSLHFG